MKTVEMAARDHREVSSDEESAAAGDLRRGPWTVEEDLLLVNYIAAHGEGRWNALARCAGLKRTGKSCRLRWLNYLRPDLRRGSITAQEQLLILELHSRWGNRWSKIAQHLPGRTDNEIKNYWRTRVQKHARQLNCDVNSQQFKDLMRYLWMPRLLESVHSDAKHDDAPLPLPADDSGAASCPIDNAIKNLVQGDMELSCTTAASSSSMSTDGMQLQLQQLVVSQPLLVTAAGAESAFPGGNHVASYSNNNTGSMCDTLRQPPHAEYPAQFGAETCWSDESLVPGLSGVYADMDLPELGETMWGAGADDLWYTQIMGL